MRNDSSINNNNHFIKSLKNYKSTVTNPFDLKTQLSLLRTCGASHFFFNDIVSVSVLLKLISTYQCKVEENEENKNIHKEMMKKVSDILRKKPELAFKKGTHTVYSKGCIGSKKENNWGDPIIYSFQIPTTYHESPFQCAYRTGNQYLYNLIFQLAINIPGVVTKILKEIAELEAHSFGYHLLLRPTLTAEEQIENLLPRYTHIFILAENEELPKSIPTNTILVSWNKELGVNSLEIYEQHDDFDRLDCKRSVIISDDLMTIITSSPNNKLNVITCASEKLFNRILNICGYKSPALSNRVTLIKQLNKESGHDFYLWSEANSKWSLNMLPNTSEIYQDLLQLKFPNSSQLPLELDEVNMRLYQEFSNYHSILFDVDSAVRSGNRFINKSTELRNAQQVGVDLSMLDRFENEDRISELKKIIEILWLEVGKEQQNFPTWFWHFWDLEFFTEEDVVTLTDTQNLWEIALNFNYQLDLISRMLNSNAFIDNIGLYWAFQYKATTPGCYITIRSPNSEGYSRDNEILASLSNLIKTARSRFKKNLLACEKLFQNENKETTSPNKMLSRSNEELIEKTMGMKLFDLSPKFIANANNESKESSMNIRGSLEDAYSAFAAQMTQPYPTVFPNTTNRVKIFDVGNQKKIDAEFKSYFSDKANESLSRKNPS